MSSLKSSVVTTQGWILMAESELEERICVCQYRTLCYKRRPMQVSKSFLVKAALKQKSYVTSTSFGPIAAVVMSLINQELVCGGRGDLLLRSRAGKRRWDRIGSPSRVMQGPATDEN
ncbi:hypothetical protein E2562_029911 [Oryza meyeriana var. granulata]|uniref:Uncharacterized protein n=1 Tax=Oryza meyeriana var. granulata TaxID=110450 RepID=A0A6G1CUF7_9ORYZ|nr:hypothetical protein E2562_029911 [Oryza meyeriana var. granulata]